MTTETTESPGHPSGRSPKAIRRIVLAVAITAIILVVLVYNGDLTRYGQVLGRAQPGLLFLGAVMMLAVAIIRAWRVALALGRPTSWSILRIIALFQFASAIAPMRLGEVVLPILLKRARITTFVSGAVILVALRLLDLAFILLFAGLGAFLIYLSNPDYRWISHLGALVMAGGLVIVSALPIAARLARHLHIANVGSTPVLRWLSPILEASGALAKGKRYAGLVASSALLQVVMLAMIHFCASAVNATPGLAGTAFAGGAGMLAFALPINGVAGAGPLEAAWTYVMGLQGVPWEEAFIGAALWHAVSLIMTTVMAGCALFASPHDSVENPVP